MKRKQRASSATTTKARPRLQPTLKQIEDRCALLLLLLQHNIDTILRRKRAR